MNLRLIAPWLIFAVIALIYLAFPTRVYYWDGIAFAQAIEDAQSLNPSLVHPNHLVYNFAGYAFYKLLRTIGFDLRALTALQILNCLLSAACACVLFAILIDTLRSLYLSVCLTFLFAFSATWWKFSTDANAYIPSVLFLLISFYLVLPDRKARPLLLAVTVFIAMAFHQLAVVAFPVFALGLYLQDGLSIKRRAVNVLVFTLITVTLIAGAYYLLFSLAAGSFDFHKFRRWTTSYSPDAETQFQFWSNLMYSLRGQVRLFFGGRFNLLKGIVNPLVILLAIALAVAVVYLFFEALWNAIKLLKLRWLRELHLAQKQKTVLLLSLSWSTFYLVFLFFWLPQNTFYRLFYLPALILLIGLAISSFRVDALRARRITAVFVTSVALANFLFLIYPFSHVEKYPPLAFAKQVNHQWPAGTVVYYALENSDKALVRYFNPSTTWKQLPKFREMLEEDLTETYRQNRTVWFETTAIEQFTSNDCGARWLETHARKDSLQELDDGAYKIRFIQVAPEQNK